MGSVNLLEFWDMHRICAGDFSAVVRFGQGGDNYTERMRYYYHPYGGYYRVCKDSDTYDSEGRLIRG